MSSAKTEDKEKKVVPFANVSGRDSIALYANDKLDGRGSMPEESVTFKSA